MITPVGMIGLGNMGTTIAHVIAGNGYPVIGWEHNGDVVAEINDRHLNARYLSGIPLHQNVTATKNIDEIARRCHIIFIALPSQFISSALAPLSGMVASDAVIANLAKGIDKESGRTSSDILADLFPNHPCVMVSGPSIANEIAHGMPTAVVAAGNDDTALNAVKNALQNRNLLVSLSHDMRGTELGGIMKNIYAMGLGVFDGMHIASINFRSVYLTLALREMVQTSVRLGASPETLLFISGLGDLFATSLSEHSHNRRLGELLSSCADIEEVRQKLGVVPEGYNTLEAFLHIAADRGFHMPLAEALWGMIHCRITADTFMHTVIEGLIHEKIHSCR